MAAVKDNEHNRGLVLGHASRRQEGDLAETDSASGRTSIAVLADPLGGFDNFARINNTPAQALEECFEGKVAGDLKAFNSLPDFFFLYFGRATVL